ncbi:MAG TPA: DNA-processing protein DprA [Candidatus Saccharimonadales bacterium]|nr:DNA-processing protein DprA [Candidatus Saccharimonadales bacterium]
MSILSYIKSMNINRIATDDHIFLKGLRNIANYPKSLYLIGRLPKESRPTVAIVGTRKPSPYGREVARRLAYDLAKQGIVVVSGLAIGIDTVVHQAALEAGGTTIAVLAGGLNSIHPSSNRQLAIDIVTHDGALLSEYEVGFAPHKWQFVARNRLESGMSNGVLVIEAAAKSGTIHTATFARRQAKAVMAVPGNITSPMSEGANALIKRGALAVTEAKDVLRAIKAKPLRQTALTFDAPAEQRVILLLLAAGVQTQDDLQAQSNLEPALFNQALTLLELSGKIRQISGTHWALA